MRTQIGIVLAAPLVVRWRPRRCLTGIADRYDALRGTLMAAAIAAPFGYTRSASRTGSGRSWSWWLVSSTFGSIFALSDAYALKGLAARAAGLRPLAPVGLGRVRRRQPGAPA